MTLRSLSWQVLSCKMLHVRSALPPSRGSETSQYWELIFIRHANQGSPDASTQPPLALTGAWSSRQAARSAGWRPIKKLVFYARRKKRRTKVASSRPQKKNQSNQKNSLQESMTACFVQRQQKNASDLRKTRGTRMQNNIVKRPLKSETTPKLIQTRTSRC